MIFNNFTYVIINTVEVTDSDSTIDFSQLLNTKASMLRYSTGGDKTIVKYNGTQPSFLSGKSTYTHQEILAIVRDVDGDWYKEIQI
tara:strand:- start:108 stop:365 length:258 start_codon:yes stop_codon:yes gene_type:complete